MTEIGKFLVFIGLALVVLGALAWGLGRVGFKGLPGDIHYQGQNWSVSFPVATCLVISLVMSLAMLLWNWLRRGS